MEYTGGNNESFYAKQNRGNIGCRCRSRSGADVLFRSRSRKEASSAGARQGGKGCERI